MTVRQLGVVVDCVWQTCCPLGNCRTGEGGKKGHLGQRFRCEWGFTNLLREVEQHWLEDPNDKHPKSKAFSGAEKDKLLRDLDDPKVTWVTAWVNGEEMKKDFTDVLPKNTSEVMDQLREHIIPHFLTPTEQPRFEFVDPRAHAAAPPDPLGILGERPPEPPKPRT